MVIPRQRPCTLVTSAHSIAVTLPVGVAPLDGGLVPADANHDAGIENGPRRCGERNREHEGDDDLSLRSLRASAPLKTTAVIRIAGKAGATEGAEDLERRGPELRPAVDHHGLFALDQTEREERCVAEAHDAGETGELPVSGAGHIFEDDKTQNDTKRHSHFLPA